MGRRSTGRRRGKVSPRGLARFLLLYRSSEFARHVELRVGHRGAGRSIGAGHRDARRVAMPPRKGDARDVMRRGTHLDVDADPDWGGSCARSMHRAAFCAAADATRTGIPPRARGKPAAGRSSARFVCQSDQGWRSGALESSAGRHRDVARGPPRRAEDRARRRDVDPSDTNPRRRALRPSPRLLPRRRWVAREPRGAPRGRPAGCALAAARSQFRRRAAQGIRIVARARVHDRRARRLLPQRRTGRRR